MWKCPECGYKGEPIVEESVENTDRDGRRGVMITWVTCPKCGYEEGIK